MSKSLVTPSKQDPVDAAVEFIEKSIKSKNTVDEEKLVKRIEQAGQHLRIAEALENAAKKECYDIVDTYFTAFGEDKNSAAALAVAQSLFNGDAADNPKVLGNYRTIILERLDSEPLKARLLQGASKVDADRQQAAQKLAAEKAEMVRSEQAAEATRQRLEQHRLQHKEELRKQEVKGLAKEDQQEYQDFLAALEKEPDEKPKVSKSLKPQPSASLQPSSKITREEVESHLSKARSLVSKGPRGIQATALSSNSKQTSK